MVCSAARRNCASPHSAKSIGDTPHRRAHYPHTQHIRLEPRTDTQFPPSKSIRFTYLPRPPFRRTTTTGFPTTDNCLLRHPAIIIIDDITLSSVHSVPAQRAGEEDRIFLSENADVMFDFARCSSCYSHAYHSQQCRTVRYESSRLLPSTSTTGDWRKSPTSLPREFLGGKVPKYDYLFYSVGEQNRMTREDYQYASLRAFYALHFISAQIARRIDEAGAGKNPFRKKEYIGRATLSFSYRLYRCFCLRRAMTRS